MKVWDTATGQVLLTLKGHGASNTGVTFNPDGRYLASASFDGTTRVWDAVTGQEVLKLIGVVQSEVSPSAQSVSPTGRGLCLVWAALSYRP